MLTLNLNLAKKFPTELDAWEYALDRKGDFEVVKHERDFILRDGDKFVAVDNEMHPLFKQIFNTMGF